MTTANRNANLPNVPTLGESGFSGVDVVSAQSLLVPAGTSPEIVTKLNVEVAKILELPDVKARWAQWGFLPQQPQTPPQVAGWFAQETQKWTKLIREKHITAE